MFPLSVQAVQSGERPKGYERKRLPLTQVTPSFPCLRAYEYKPVPSGGCLGCLPSLQAKNMKANTTIEHAAVITTATTEIISVVGTENGRRLTVSFPLAEMMTECSVNEELVKSLLWSINHKFISRCARPSLLEPFYDDAVAPATFADVVELLSQATTPSGVKLTENDDDRAIGAKWEAEFNQLPEASRIAAIAGGDTALAKYTEWHQKKWGWTPTTPSFITQEVITGESRRRAAERAAALAAKAARVAKVEATVEEFTL